MITDNQDTTPTDNENSNRAVWTFGEWSIEATEVNRSWVLLALLATIAESTDRERRLNRRQPK